MKSRKQMENDFLISLGKWPWPTGSKIVDDKINRIKTGFAIGDKVQRSDDGRVGVIIDIKRDLIITKEFAAIKEILNAKDP